MQSDARLVAEACGRAARVLGLSRDELSAVVGKHRTSIDETLNRTGVKLSVFELLTARFWSQDLKLRELWEQARSDHPLIAHFDVDPLLHADGHRPGRWQNPELQARRRAQPHRQHRHPVVAAGD